MKNAKRLFTLLLMPALALCLCACTLKPITLNILGHDVTLFDNSSDPAPDTRPYAEQTTQLVELPEEMETASRFNVYTDEETGTVYIAFNGVRNRYTDYFYPDESGKITITAHSDIDYEYGREYFKFALWKKVEGGTEYINESTRYFWTDDRTFTYTLSGLDPESPYRLYMTYDSVSAYLYGAARIEGIDRWAE